MQSSPKKGNKKKNLQLTMNQSLYTGIMWECRQYYSQK